MDLLFENETLWVWNKPSGWHSSKGANEPSVESFLEKTLDQKISESGLLHRLDEPTSGCLAAAKSQEAYEKYKYRFREGLDVQKIYWAIVFESFPPRGDFELYFSSRYKSSKKMSVSSKGAVADKGLCSWQSLRQSEGAQLLEVRLIGPGRRHQIRAGLAYTHSALLGDALYGGPPKVYFGLHARSLIVDELRIDCPAPSSWPKDLTL